MSNCIHGSEAPDPVIIEIHESQAGQREGVEIWRHKCCYCSFAQGEALGRVQAIAPGGNAVCRVTGQRADWNVMDALPPSQAGAGRHHCAICAFHEGFKRGRALAEAANKS